MQSYTDRGTTTRGSGGDINKENNNNQEEEGISFLGLEATQRIKKTYQIKIVLVFLLLVVDQVALF